VGYGAAYVHFEGKDDILMVLMEDVMEQFFIRSQKFPSFQRQKKKPNKSSKNKHIHF
jgi:AcrR family transcriptional regulator